ncbi:group II intron reverse transcriptase/maturase [Alicyclobacillus cycloheptanicus]|nr:group II intron reverse transcriptase/maturase [Alicyclobacillus cycloheptanicus]WDM00927.1 group II intron reverse transcriptase/maturase [Alicyclobacillus cycloheptanicus]WDM01508.1 group II intron reverse transcriptase/maturase [Alicyclobacillus cycloheptanicus]WDM02220.1 group II intron reverse transcriptase/maturase [Alicyclobacillus cycloheptanicus]WDM02363.1 group II intron reverse transcriptase/maturase [Alicyclobacillus cycloheptanicus]
MRSHDEQRQQNTPQGASTQRVAVKPREAEERGPSSSSVQGQNPSCEDSTNLLERMLQRENMLQALKRVESNKGAPGVDGVTVEQLRSYVQTHWADIRQQLLAGTYKPQPVRRVEIPKPGGGMRKLGIPAVIDRLIQQALLQVLTPIFDPGFSPNSYGFRPGRNAHDAVKKAQEYIREGYAWTVDMDLAAFFDRVNHDMLMARVARKVKDKRVLRLIRAYLNAGVLENGVVVRSEEGTPQGGPLSPLLANILLDDFDKELTKRGHKFVRYADDCNVYVKSRRAGERVMASLTRYLEEDLKLKVNRDKSAVDRPQRRKFLGFSFLYGKQAPIRLADKTIQRFKDRVRQITSRTRSMPLAERIRQLNAYMMGWVAYFRLAQMKGHCERFDEWIRRRLRMCIWKQWKRVRTRYRELRALNQPEWVVHMMANSRRGPWFMAKNLNNAMDKAYFEALGLKSLQERYLQLRSVS